MGWLSWPWRLDLAASDAEKGRGDEMELDGVGGRGQLGRCI